MKKITLNFLFIFTLLFATNTIAQTRYLDPVFPSVDTTNNIVYGVNYTVMVPGYVLPTGAVIPGVGAIPSLNFQFLNLLEILNQKDLLLFIYILEHLLQL